MAAKETFEQLVARINASAFYVDDPTAGVARAPKAKAKAKAPKGSGKLGKLLAKASREMTHEQLQLMFRLLSGKAAEVLIDGDKYVVWMGDDGLRRVQRMDLSTSAHTVGGPAGCTCEDRKFHRLVSGHECKHMRAVKRLGGAL